MTRPRAIDEACGDAVRGECAERFDALEQRIETAERTGGEMQAVLRKVESDVSYIRGRFDAMVALPAAQPLPVAPRGPGRRRLAVNLGLGGVGLVALIDLVKDLFH